MTTLKRLRQSAGLTRDEFAQIANISPETLEKHEQGRYRMPLETATRYAQELARVTAATPSKLLLVLAGLEEQ